MTIKESFSRINGLTWMPWIGEKFTSCSNHIMVLGESHYLHDGLSCEDIDNDPGYTSEVVREYVVYGKNGGDQWKMYEPIERVLRGVCFDDSTERQDIWNSIAYMNIIQHVLEEKSGGKKWMDFYNGWRIILQVVHIIKPGIIICFSTDKLLNRVNFNRLPEFKDNVDYEYTITPNADTNIKIGRDSVASPGGITFTEDGVLIPVVFLRHAARTKGECLEAWQDVLMRTLCQLNWQSAPSPQTN